MMHPISGWRFARALAAVVLLSVLCSVDVAYGALNASVGVSPDTGHGSLVGDASVIGSFVPPREPIGFSGLALPANPGSFNPLEAPSDIASNPDASGLVNRGLSQTPGVAKVRDDLAVVNAATTATTATTADTATQPIPAPTEYMLLAGGLLILWGALRWKNRARPLVDMPRSCLKKR